LLVEFIAMKLTAGLFYDNYWSAEKSLFQCWASFAENESVDEDRPWHILCVYTRPEDVHWNKNVDIRFYSSLEKQVNEGRQLDDKDASTVQLFLRQWSNAYLDAYKDLLPSKLTYLFGSFHSALAPSVHNAFNAPPSASSQPYLKYLIRRENSPTTHPAVPSGLEVDAIFTQHFDVILSSSSIPRNKQYLQTRIPASTAVYRGSSRDNAPIAFSVTAPDRSLSMLWVDPGYRNRGLGSWVAEDRLVGPYGMLEREWDDARDRHGAEKEISGSWKAEGTRFMWSHADVDVKNTGSRRICEGLGGTKGWTVVWIRVEVEV
jgi:ribosomal protein S18 acetylase RimI-like enzyme